MEDLEFASIQAPEEFHFELPTMKFSAVCCGAPMGGLHGCCAVKMDRCVGSMLSTVKYERARFGSALDANEARPGASYMSY